MNRFAWALLGLFAFASLVLPASAAANTLFLSPSAGSYAAGQAFAIKIMVTSETQAVNAISATLSYPKDKLQVVSISKIGSILSLWVTEPSFSNANGTVTIEGVVPNPGFQGANGLILTINFKAIAPGTASATFSSGQILANDGYGSDILATKGTGSYAISAAGESETPPAVEEAPLPAPTYLDLNKQRPTAPAPASETFSFELPSAQSVYDWALKLLSIVIPLFALLFLLFHTTKRGVANLRDVRRDIHSVDRLVEKSFDLIKDDMAESLKMLERASTRRRLTSEEDAIVRRLRQNLADAERIIHKELLKAERDIGD